MYNLYSAKQQNSTKKPGINGINTAKLLRERQEDVVLIFITGIKEYVFEALELYAFQYLLKPVDEKKLAEVLYKISRTERRYVYSLAVCAKGEFSHTDDRKQLLWEACDQWSE